MAIPSPNPSDSAGERPRFRRSLGPIGLTLLTLGGVMGSGLFLASGLAIRHAGPAAFLLFALGLSAMYLEITALGEMSAASPTPGSFLVYAKAVLSPGFLFVAGWIFWFSSVLTMSSEVTAASLFTRYWFPGIPVWGWSLFYSVGVIFLNLVSVSGFAKAEGIMSGVKIVAVLLFVGLLLGLPRWHTGAEPFVLGVRHLTAASFFRQGWRGIGAALVLVLFSYAGTGVIGMAAAETREPGRAIPRAVGASVLLAGIMYLGSVWVILRRLAWNRVPTASSPFVAALAALGLPMVNSLLNLVLLFAVLSTMNAALYANVRVLYGLARDGQAPRWLTRLSPAGLPVNAVWTSAGLLGLTILLAYWLPHRAYAYLVTATGFQAMFIWVAVLVTHLYYRPYLQTHHPDRLRYRLWGYPHTTRFVLAVVMAGMIGAFFSRAELAGAIVGGAGIAVATLVWLALRRRLPAPLE